MIRIRGLRKTYGDFVAVHGLDLEARRGEVLALLGPNGAGKSTTVQCLVGLLRPDSGAIEIADVDALRQPIEARRITGYVPEVANIYQALTPTEFLTLKARLFDLDEAEIEPAIDRLLGGFGLLDRRLDPMLGFSKGMTQKVVLAAALITNPKVLVLDEPLSGLDVETTLLLKELIRQFASGGGTVLYCSHLLDVVETLADRVAVIDGGNRVALGTMSELRAGRAEGAPDRLEHLFQELTEAGDPVVMAQRVLGRE